MMRKARIALVGCLILASVTAMAQTTFYLDGYGRTVMTNDKLTGDAIDDDTLSTPSKGAGGYTLFDLGLNIEKNKAFKVNGILRVRNEFGLFYGQGTSLDFRQLRMEGVIGKGVKYELGDIDVKLSPYTVFNNDEMFNDFESEIFSTRRDILEYENFNIGNHWRMQGLQGQTTLLFDKGIEKLYVKGFGVRTNPTNQLDRADRIMTGWNATATVVDGIKFGVNYAGMLDLPISIAQEEYTNHVVTAVVDIDYDLNDNIAVLLDGEAGRSIYDMTQLATDTSVKFEDNVFDVKAGVFVKPLALTAQAGYKLVGAQFSSPGAQTRRIDVDLIPALFPTIPDNVDSVVTDRSQLLYDRFTQEAIYNRSISNTLGSFVPYLSNVSPYGAATRNRNGLYVNLAHGNVDSSIYVMAQIDLSDEDIADNNADRELRDFTAIRAGLAVDVAKKAGFKKDLVVTVGYNSESTTRGGSTDIDLTSTLMDIGVTAEVFDNFDLLFGGKMLNAKGNEFIHTLNDFNQIDGVPTEMTVDLSEQVISFGGRFRFSDDASINVFYNTVGFTDNLATANSYDLSQLFLNFSLKF